MKRALLILALCAGMLAPSLASVAKKAADGGMPGRRSRLGSSGGCLPNSRRAGKPLRPLRAVRRAVHSGPHVCRGRGRATGLRRGRALVPPGSRAGTPQARRIHSGPHVCQNGQGVPQDYAEAARWFRRAAEQEHPKAQYNLGVMYNNGHVVLQDYAEAARWYRRAAEQGYRRGAEQSGHHVRRGQGRATGLRRGHARGTAGQPSRNTPSAQNNLGIMYDEGQGRTTGLRRGRALVPPGSRAGTPRGAEQSGRHVRYEGEGVPQDYAEAVRWYRRAAEQGHRRGAEQSGHHVR